MENEVKTGRIEQVNIDEQMRSAYIDYSMYLQTNIFHIPT